MPILTGTARVAGIIGWPVSHSRSPRLHGFWLDRYGINGAYVPLPIRPDQFASAVGGLKQAGFAGANVTIPHKVAAFQLCDHIDETAHRAGAVNTLVFDERGVLGSNTDGYGFLADLRAHAVFPGCGPALIVGAGGAARAVAAALLQENVPVTITNRSPERAAQLLDQLPGLRVLPWSDRESALRDTGMLINTTPLGMAGHPALDLRLDQAAATIVVCDIVYVPLETPLLAEARARGLRTVEGLGMLLHQAVPGFKAWFGVLPEVDDELRRFVAADLIQE